MQDNDSKDAPQDTVESRDYRPYTPEEDPPTLPFPHWEHLLQVLLPHHLEMLTKASAIDPMVVYERGDISIEGAEGYSLLKSLKFSRAQANNLPGLLLPLWTTDGQQSLSIYRPDTPRLDKEGRIVKYEVPTGASIRVDCHPRCQPMLGNPHIPLWCTEGQKKGDALVSLGACALALLGVYGWRGKNEHGGIVPLDDFNLIAWNGREVRLAFDSDVWEKPQARKALDRFTAFLHNKGAMVRIVVLPSMEGGKKMGVDDFIAQGHTLAELEALIDIPRLEPQPAKAQLELLFEAPETLRKPLQLLGEHAYAATWLWVKRTETEGVNRAGHVVRFAVPKVTRERSLFIVRDDGVIFGDGGDSPFPDLGAQVELPTMPREERLWQAYSVQAYRNGYRPDPVKVFRRVVAVYNRFIDFDRSLIDQDIMCELSACFSLVTWLHDAFAVLGYPWPTGERGSGKTQWGYCWARTSYLGEVLLSSGSFAALRDLADYGATLMFDDAEILSDPRKADPNKRELFLAGNRVGASIPLKEQLAPGKWETRWVNAYGPRGFTAIRTPDPVMASRAILLPLVRTADPRRGNADPADDETWPEPQRVLQDDLWALALLFLPKAARLWQDLGEEGSIIGREFEPWRAVLTVARLFETVGVSGLEGRIRKVLAAYQKEKGELVGQEDRLVVVVKALLQHAEKMLADTKNTKNTKNTMFPDPGVENLKNQEIEFTAKSLSETIKEMVAAESEEEQEAAAEWVTPSRIGRLLNRLRFPQQPQGKQRTRTRTVSVEMLLALGKSYGVQLFQHSHPHLAKLSVLSVLSVLVSAKPTVGDAVFLLSHDGVQQNTTPYIIQAIEQGPDGRQYGRFAEQATGWPLECCERVPSSDDSPPVGDEGEEMEWTA